MRPPACIRVLRGSLALLLAALLTSASAAAEQLPARETPVQAPASVLFVGNSFTFYNNGIHTHLRRLLAAEDPALRDAVFLKSMTVSGAVLSDHRRGLEQMLEQWDWDVIVLQGHSLEALEAASMENFRAAAQQLASMVAADGGRPVLFMTWAYANQPDMTPGLNQAYSELGRELGAMVVPVGLAFDRALAENPGLSLHTADLKHPTLEGTYLAACVFYAALWGKSPAALDYDAGLPDDVAAALRQAAWRTIKDYEGTK